MQLNTCTGQYVKTYKHDIVGTKKKQLTGVIMLLPRLPRLVMLSWLTSLR